MKAFPGSCDYFVKLHLDTALIAHDRDCQGLGLECHCVQKRSPPRRIIVAGKRRPMLVLSGIDYPSKTGPQSEYSVLCFTTTTPTAVDAWRYYRRKGTGELFEFLLKKPKPGEEPLPSRLQMIPPDRMHDTLHVGSMGALPKCLFDNIVQECCLTAMRVEPQTKSSASSTGLLAFGVPPPAA